MILRVHQKMVKQTYLVKSIPNYTDMIRGKV